jgi:hypothetical protein
MEDAQFRRQCISLMCKKGVLTSASIRGNRLKRKVAASYGVGEDDPSVHIEHIVDLDILIDCFCERFRNEPFQQSIMSLGMLKDISNDKNNLCFTTSNLNKKKKNHPRHDEVYAYLLAARSLVRKFVIEVANEVDLPLAINIRTAFEVKYNIEI